MKLIYVTTTFPYSWGQEEFLAPEIRELLVRGHALKIVPRSIRGRVNAEYEEFLPTSVITGLLSLPVLGIALAQSLLHPLRSLRALLALAGGASLMNLGKNLAIFPKALWLGYCARKWRVDHIHAQWAGTNASIAHGASIVSDIPWSFTAHRGDIVENNQFSTKLGSASFVRFISESGCSLAQIITKSRLPQHCRVVHMGIRIPDEPTSPRCIRSTPTIACPANLRRVKGHTYLLRALSSLGEKGINFRLLIIGRGELEEELREEATSLGIASQTSFMGYIDQPELFRMYQEGEIDLIVLPSVDLGSGEHEGIPVTLIEAMAFGIPVISTATGGIPELLSDGSGVMVPDKCPQALAEAIERVLGDQSLSVRLGLQGRTKVVAEFAIGRVVDRLADYLEQASAGRPA